jgi:hypothetical protein
LDGESSTVPCKRGTVFAECLRQEKEIPEGCILTPEFTIATSVLLVAKLEMVNCLIVYFVHKFYCYHFLERTMTAMINKIYLEMLALALWWENLICS